MTFFPGLPAAALLLLLSGLPAVAGAVFDRVTAADTLSCGILTEPADYGKTDIHGATLAFDRDICRAVAAALLRDPDKLTLVRLSNEDQGYRALDGNRIDLLLGATPTTSAGARGVRFGPTIFLDGVGLLVNRAGAARSLADLAGKQICYIAGTDAEAVLVSEVGRRGLRVLPFPFEEEGEMEAALLVSHCEAVIDSKSRLAAARAGFRRQAVDFAILPDTLSLEPMAPAFLDGDRQWGAVVEAVVEAVLLAETAGVGRSNAAVLRTTDNPVLRTLGGLIPGIDEARVDRDWAVRVLGAVGNYAELFERDLGPESALGLARGPNAPWTAGGLLMAHPVR